jgi:hypothetical protein
MTDPFPMPEVPQMDPVPAQPDIDPAATPDEMTPMPDDDDGGLDRPPAEGPPLA